MTILLLACGDGNGGATDGRGGDATMKTVPVNMQLTTGGCTAEQVATIGSLEVTLAAGETRASPCIVVSDPSLDDLQQALRNDVRFGDLSAGSVRVTVRGYTDGACTEALTALCGDTDVSLPPPADPVGLTVDCWGGSEVARFDRCAGVTSGNVQVDLQQGQCTGEEIEHARSARIVVDTGGREQDDGCVAIAQTSSFTAFKAQLGARLRLSGISSGTTTVSLWAFEEDACQRDKVAVCGQTTFDLPGASTPGLTVHCLENPAFSACPAAP